VRPLTLEEAVDALRSMSRNDLTSLKRMTKAYVAVFFPIFVSAPLDFRSCCLVS
jgi:hypothetical protein